jgi:FAD/FMN-containing dehydrogenase
MGRVKPGATAFNERDISFVANCLVRSDDEAAMPPVVEWARSARDAIARFGRGRMYVNFTGQGDGDKSRTAYPPETYERLAQLKRKYDPDNVFRFNHNIAPAA